MIVKPKVKTITIWFDNLTKTNHEKHDYFHQRINAVWLDIPLGLISCSVRFGDRVVQAIRKL
jgi:hypothetical protein